MEKERLTEVRQNISRTAAAVSSPIVFFQQTEIIAVR